MPVSSTFDHRHRRSMATCLLNSGVVLLLASEALRSSVIVTSSTEYDGGRYQH